MRSSKSWKDTAELVGIAAIVASLIFVGLQMRQSQEIAIAAQYQARADMALQYFALNAEGEESIGYRYRQLSSPTGRYMQQPEFRRFAGTESPETVVLSYQNFRMNMTLLDNYHFQYESGFMPEDAWLAFRSVLESLLSDEPNISFYLADTARYRPSFKAVCDGLMGP